ncbi:DNA-binding domain-containing protein [Vineibacter terrae]|uniref:HvfC/BufC N-terminal domain-containing protein n=1 Tax=Vineibacter terrae TaxID=2586908 RepID=UPI002E35EC97|nr:DNA-binding domain-containing protein [Vineibacter terrae]HEX2891429.1 DNA-binding domain-containing protein [Vineibacter terrae]
MPSLGEVQMAFGQAVLGADETVAIGMIDGNGLDPSARLALYRNQIFGSLTAALRVTYPVLCQLVHERFFDRVAHSYVAAHPPMQPCLSEYGAGLATFVAHFPGCTELPYLKDVAALE